MVRIKQATRKHKPNRGSLYPGGPPGVLLTNNNKRHNNPEPSPPLPQPPLRGRLKRSARCTECQRGHRQCDGKRPCGRCVHVGREGRCGDKIASTPSVATKNNKKKISPSSGPAATAADMKSAADLNEARSSQGQVAAAEEPDFSAVSFAKPQTDTSKMAPRKGNGRSHRDSNLSRGLE